MTGTERVLVVARNELALMRSEYLPLSLYFIMPLALLAFVQGAFDIFLQLGDPTSTSSGADLAAPGQATMFGLISLASFGHFFLGEHGWGTWNRLRSIGVRPWQILGGKMLIVYLQQLLLFVFVMSAGAVLFDLTVTGSLLALALVELATAATIVGYGLVACALATSQAQFNAFAYLGALLLAGVGGALTPFDTLPGWAQSIAPAMPTYWAVRAFETVMIDGGGVSDVTRPVAVLVGFAVGLLLLGTWLFDPDKRRSTWT